MTFEEVLLRRKVRELEHQVQELEEDKLLLQHLLDVQEVIETSGLDAFPMSLPESWNPPGDNETPVLGDSGIQLKLDTPSRFYDPGLSFDDIWCW